MIRFLYVVLAILLISTPGEAQNRARHQQPRHSQAKAQQHKHPHPRVQEPKHGKNHKSKHGSRPKARKDSCLDKPPAKPSLSLKGSCEALRWQNIMANRLGLTRIDNDGQLQFFVKKGLLVPLSRAHVVIDPRLQADNRYVRPQVVRALNDLAADYKKEFGGTLQVNSAVRTVADQRALNGSNGNAAPPTGPMASSHLTGATVDIRHKGLSRKQRAWVGKYLLRLEGKGWAEATQEKKQAVFHVMFYPNYGK